MKGILALSVVLGVFGCQSPEKAEVVTATTAPQPGPVEQVTLNAADGSPVYGDFYRAKKQPPVGVVLMFHQAGSNSAEYETIAPRIVVLGYDCLAIDQRSGGNMWDRVNKTAQEAKGPKDYMAAYNDLMGAQKWAETKGYKKIVDWGSSYSAALTLRLASEAKKVDAILVFSPGEYFDDKKLVTGWASKIKQPVFFACPPDELADRQAIFDAIPKNPKNMLVSLPGGVHGSSTLIPMKAPEAAAANWEKVTAFFKSLG